MPRNTVYRKDEFFPYPRTVPLVTCALKIWRRDGSPHPAYEYRTVNLPGVSELSEAEARELLDRLWAETTDPARMTLQAPFGTYERTSPD